LKRAGINSNWRGGNNPGRARSPGVISGPGKKKTLRWRVGPDVSEWESGIGYRFGRGVAGPWAPFSVGPKGLPRPLF
jgi:hypothetical protein